MRRALLLGAGAAAGAALAAATAAPVAPPAAAAAAAAPPTAAPRPPARAAQWRALAAATAADPLDVLVLGGGATGAGAALDAAARGLRVALVERDDFAAGTSSRSTKLVHGGVRYLEKAVKGLDAGQLKLVFEALRERRTILEIAPHLATPLPIMTPLYAWWEVPYYWAGLKAYDAVAALGAGGLHWSRYEAPGAARAAFPTLAARRAGDGRSLKGAIVYWDGQFDDARLALAAALTAAAAGAAVANHAEAVALLRDPATGRVAGARVRDTLTGAAVDVHARVVVNAGGPFADDVRRLAEPAAPPMLAPSAGVHVTLPDYYSPEGLGMIVPKTRDGRVVFMLPWQGETIAGTTDAPAAATATPQPSEADIAFILDAISDYLTVKVRRSDVKSAWSGLRPLAVDPGAADSASALRDHVVAVSPGGLVTVAGGKWTTYRLMAEDAIDKAVQVGGLEAKARPCATAHLPLVGAAGWSPALFTEVAQGYRVPHRAGAIDTRVAKHLAGAYGGRAREVTALAEAAGLGRRLARGYPVIEAEVLYCMRAEFCEAPEDFLARRCRLAFLDRAAALEALPRVVELMAAERGWGRRRAAAEAHRARAFLDSFEAPGGAPAPAPAPAPPAPRPEAAKAGERAPAAGAVDPPAKAAAA